MAAGSKPSGCICASASKLCACTTDGLHSLDTCGVECSAHSPFAAMDEGLGLHSSVCSCQRCIVRNEGILGCPGSPGSASSRAEMKGAQTCATPGPALVLHSDADRREFISAGAAGGLAVCPEASRPQPSESCATCTLKELR